MIAYVGRLAGALFVQSHDSFFLVGNTKRPCNWEACGLAAPGEIDAIKHPFVRLSPLQPLEIPVPRLRIEVAKEQLPETLAQVLADRFLIVRNGSVSDRLWRLILQKGDDPESLTEEVDATWLAEMPPHVWKIVREAVLRCV
jgi:hypothetical protein